MLATINKASRYRAAAERRIGLRESAGGARYTLADAAAAGLAEQASLRRLAYLLVGLSFLFMMFPGIDLFVSAKFADAQGGFPLTDNALLTEIRDLNRLVPKLLLPGLAICLLWSAFRPGVPIPVAPHKALFILSVYALGGGVIVNGLKGFVGRARPDAILQFGGTETFTVAWQLSGACLRNCSFASGEAASAAAMLSCAVVLPGRLRLAALAALMPLALAFSGARIAFGKHFLSDVVVSWLILAIVIVALWRVFRTHRAAIDRAVIGAGLPLLAAPVAWLGRPARR